MPALTLLPAHSASAISAQLRRLAEGGEAEALMAFLSGLADRDLPGKDLPLLLRLAHRLGLPALRQRILAIGAGPEAAPATRLLLVQGLMGRRDRDSSLDAWRALDADPRIFASGSGRQAIRWLAMLRLRLPPGEARAAAEAAFARHHALHPDPEELRGVELRERLRLLADADDWAGCCRLATEIDDRHFQGDAPAHLLTAALEIGDHDSARRALAAMRAEQGQPASGQPAPERPDARFSLAHRLVVGGMPQEAWALLNHPSLLQGDEATSLRLMQHLQKLQAAAGPELRAEVQALRARLTAPRLPHAAVRPFPAPGTGHAPIAAVVPQQVFAARGMAPAQVELFRGLVVEKQRMAQACLEGAPSAILRPRVMLYRDVSVDETGHVWDAAGRVAPVLHWPVMAGRAPAPAESAHVPRAVVATDIPRNFFHWFAEGLPMLAWRLAEGAPDLPILHNGAAAGLIGETLSLLSDTPFPLVRVEGMARVGEAHVAQRGFTMLYHWQHFGELYARLVRRAMARSRPGVSGKWLYLSRRDVGRRAIVNEPALEEALAGLGFTVLTFHGRPLAEQIRAFQEAEVVVTPHGAGLAHLAAARPGLKVFELMPSRAGTERLRCCYSLLSALRGHRHALWLEPVRPASLHWEIDLPGMLSALRRFLEETPQR